MNRFEGDLVIRREAPGKGNKRVYTLVEPLTYHSDAFGKITAPAGLETDFASIPRGIWNYLNPEDDVIAFASVIHDAIYSLGGRMGERVFTRAEADEVLREAMIASGARKTQAWVVHKAVRLFGGSHW